MKNDMIRLWYHENLRVFQVLNQQPVLYGDFMSPNSDTKLYSEVIDHEKVCHVFVVLCGEFE